MKKLLLPLLIIALSCYLLLPFNETEARQGCCSHHGGVCGCHCCDGTSLSATCAPYYPSCSTQPTPRLTPTCPSNSTYNSSSGACECNYGYIASESECIDIENYCHDKYGSHSSYDILSKSCKCNYGYTLISGKCIKPEPTQEQAPIEEPELTPTGTTTEPQTPKEELPAPEKFTAEIPKNDNGGSIWWWIIGIGFIAYIIYSFKQRK